MAVVARFRKGALLGMAISLVASAALLLASRAIADARAGPEEVRIGTASEGGAYGKIGRAFAPFLERELPGTTVRALTTPGSVANRAGLESGDLELALIQSDVKASEAVQVVTPLYHEYLHIVVDTERVPDARTIRDLEGRHVAIGPAGSGTRAFVRKLLTFYRVKVQADDAESVEQEKRRLLARGGLGEPKVDAVCRVAGRPDTVIEEILRDRRMKLIPLEEGMEGARASIRGFHVRHPGYETRFLDAVYPGQTGRIGTIAVTALLVARADLPGEFVHQVARVFAESRAEMRADPDIDRYLGQVLLPKDLYHFRYHPGALAFHREGPAAYAGDLPRDLLLAGGILLFGLAVLLGLRELQRAQRQVAVERKAAQAGAGEQPHDVFLSYSSRSRAARAAVEQICEMLESREMRCWYAPRDIVGGREWPESIPGAIRRTELAMVMVFTHEANASQHIARELTLASSNELEIIPYRLEDVLPQGTLEYHVAHVQWIDAFGRPRGEALAELLHAIERIQARPAGEPAPPAAATPPPPDARRRFPARWVVAGVAAILLAVAGLWRPWESIGPSGPAPLLREPAEGAMVLGDLFYRWEFEGHGPGVRYEVRRSTADGREETSAKIAGNVNKETELRGVIEWRVRALVPGPDGDPAATRWSEPRTVESYEDTLHRIESRGVVRVAIGDEMTPRSDADPELLLIRRAIEDHLEEAAPGTALEIRTDPVPFARLETLFTGEDADEYDLMAARISIRPERESLWNVRFTKPWTVYPQAFVHVEGDDLRPGRRLRPGTGRCRIGVVRKTVNEKLARELVDRRGEGEVVPFQDAKFVYDNMYNELRHGNLELLLMDLPFALQLQEEARRLGRSTLAVVTTEKVLDPAPPPERIGLAVKKIDTRLVRVLDEGLERHREEIERLFEGLEPEPMLAPEGGG